MNNKGFTLMEIISVILVIGIIGTIAVIGVSQFEKITLNEIFEGQKEHLLLGAKNYGIDNQVLLTDTCYINEKIILNCKEITVDSIKDYIKISDECDGESCYKNSITDKDMAKDEMIIYIENDIVYSEFISIKSCTVNEEEICK